MGGVRSAVRQRRACVTGALRVPFLKSTAITGGVLAALIAAQQSARADCTVTSGPNTVTCAANTTTTNTTNTDAASTTSSDRTQQFTATGAVTGTVNVGKTVNGFGLSIQNTQSGAGGNITFTNSGTVKADDASAGNALTLTSANGDLISATNAGTITGQTGSGNVGLDAGSFFSTSSVSIDNSGSVSGAQRGISADRENSSGAPTINITSSGTVAALENLVSADAIYARVKDGDGTVSITGGTVSTGTGNFASAVRVISVGAGTAKASVSGGSVSSSGDLGSAIAVTSSGSGNAVAEITGGTVSATGANASGIRIDTSAGNGATTVTVTGGSVTASGSNGTGININNGAGFASVTIGANATVSAIGTGGTGLTYATPGGGQFNALVLGTLSGTTAANINGPGTLAIGNGGTNGAIVGNVQLNDTGARLVFNRSDAIAYDGAISGTGGLEIAGGAVNLTGGSSYTNTTQIDSGATLALKGNGSIANSSFVSFASCFCGGTATFDISQTNAGASVAGLFDPFAIGVVSLGSKALTLTGNVGPYNGVISDGGIGGGTGGSLVLANGGLATLGGTNTYTGATTINSGGEIDLTGTGSIATSSKLTNNGIFDISGLTNGGTSIKSLAGGGTVHLDINTLTLTNAADAFSGVIDGSGGLNLNGGTQVLSGTNTYGGATNVNAGTLFVTGAVNGTSGVTVANGATLGGTGSVKSTTIQNGGALMPGLTAAPGTLTVNGTLTFNSGGFYVVQGAPSTTFAKTTVTGTAALTGGNTLVTFASGKYTPGRYTILTANGGLGGTQFALLNTLGLSSTRGFRNPHLIYDANDVFLVLDPATITILSSFARNQQAVANGINNSINGGANPSDSFNTLLNLTGTQLTNALTQFAGTTPGGATLAGTQLMSGFLSLVLHPNGGAPQSTPASFVGGPSHYAAETGFPREVAEAYAAAMPVKAAPAAATPFASRWSTWAAAYGGTARVSGQADIGTADTNARAYAVAGGAEYKLSPGTAVGFALAGGGTSWGLSQGLGTGAGDAFQIGGYATHNFGAAYLAGAVAYAWHDMHTDRTLTAVGTEQLHANFRAQGFGGRLEGGYRLANAWVNVTPYGALQVQTFRTPSYSEVAQAGLGAFALSYASRNTTATRTKLGAWFDKPFVLAPDRVLSLRGRIAWAHDHSSDPTLNAFFQTLPGSNFAVNTTAMPSDLALVSAGGEFKFASNWSIRATFDGEFSDRSQSYAGTGAIMRVW